LGTIWLVTSRGHNKSATQKNEIEMKLDLVRRRRRKWKEVEEEGAVQLEDGQRQTLKNTYLQVSPVICI